MSDALRELIVAIDFNDVDVSKLTKMDKAVDSIEDGIKGLGADIRRMGSVTDAAGDEGRKSLDRMASATDQAGDAMDALAKDATVTGNKVGDAAAEAKREIDKLGNAGKKAGDDAKGGTNKFLDALNNVVPQGKTAGGAAMLFSNPWVLAGAAVVGAIGGVSLALIGMSNEADKAMDRIEALTGATGEDLAGLKKTAKDVYSSGFGESLNAVGNEVSNLSGKFKDLTNDELGAFLKGLYTLQDLKPEASIESTSQAIRTMTSNFKGLGETEALDLITHAFRNGGDYAGDLLDTMKEYSPYFSKLGMDAQKMTGILLAGSDAGAWNLDKVADSVKEFGIRAIDGSDATKTAFSTLGFNADDMTKKLAGGGQEAHKAFMATVASLSFVEDKVAQNALGVQLFGTQWEDVREDVIFAMDGAEKSVVGFEGTTKKAGDALYNNVGSKWEEIKRTIGTGLGDAFGGSEGGIGSDLLDGIIAKLPEIQKIIQDFGAGVSEFLTEHKDEIKGLIDGVVGFFSGAVDLIMGVWSIIGPFVVGVLGGALDTIWNMTSMVLGAIGDVFSLFGNLLQGNWGAAWQNVKDLFSGIMDGLLKVANSVLDTLFAAFNGIFGKILNFLFGFDLSSAGQDMIKGLVKGIIGMTDWAIDAVKDVAGAMWKGFKSVMGINSPSRLMMEGGEYIVQGLEVGISDNAKSAIDAAKGMSEGVAAVTAPELGQFGPYSGPRQDNGPKTPAPTDNPFPMPTPPPKPQGSGGNGVTVHMPITVHVPPGTSADDAERIGETVQEKVDATLAKIFKQLGIKFAY